MKKENKLYSLEWFKKNMKKIIKKELINEFKKIDKQEILDQGFPKPKPYLSIKLVNNILTIVLRNGTIISKSEATEVDYYLALKANNENELYTIVSSKQVIDDLEKVKQEKLEIEKLQKGINVLSKLDNFIVEDNTIYLKGIRRSLPKLLIEKLIKIANSFSEIHSNETLSILIDSDIEYQSLKKFWIKCCLNPNAQSAEDLYTFLSKHNFKIDKHGNFYAYRRVKSKESENKELVEFISNVYTKVYAIWHRNPRNFEIWKDFDNPKEFYLLKRGKEIKSNHIYCGNLKDLYLDLSNQQSNSYTSSHTGLEDYKIGEVISMERQNGDDNNSISCSRGFHAASKEYDYSGFGDTPILVIINPIDVLTVPQNEDGKLRTCRWFFATTLSKEEEHILDDESYDVMELGDIFEEKCSNDLVKYVQNSFTEEIKRHTFNIPAISNKEIQSIVLTLNEMKSSILNRVSEIK